MTLHRQVNAYKCHYCGFTAPHTVSCSFCGNAKIIPIGFGTEKVQEKVASLFPEARLARMDHDTTRRRGSLVRILNDLRKGSIDILIGTQMVAKGHHYPNITLVGILCADLSLNFPDYRSGERTFQLLAQVAGRAGRGERPGRVILQTFNPEHFCITTARDQDLGAYFDQEIGFRKSALYPPFCRLIQVTIAGKDKARTARSARQAGEICRQIIRGYPWPREAVEIFGPVTAALSRINDRYRWHLLLKGRQVTYLHQVAKDFQQRAFQEIPAKGVRLIIDVDPVNML
jgi:primosomal protein N' (replication factor Y)